MVTGFVAGAAAEAAADEVEAVFALAVEEAVWLEVVVVAEGLVLVAGELVTPQAVKAALASPEAASADMRRTIARRGVLIILNEFRLELWSGPEVSVRLLLAVIADGHLLLWKETRNIDHYVRV